MKLTFSPAHEVFRNGIRQFLAEHGHKSAAMPMADRPGETLLAWQRLLLEHGYAGRTVPREYGGYGAAPDVLEQQLIVDEFTRAGVPLGITGQGISMLVPTLLELGTEQQKRDLIGPTLRGEIVWCQGYSEPGAGSDLASLQTQGVEDGDNFIINGQKIWTSTAHVADMIFCLVRTEPKAAKHAGISYLLFSMKSPGISIRPLKTMTGRSEFNEVFFTDVRVPQCQMIGERGDGWKVANATLKHERAFLASPGVLGQRYAELVKLMRDETLDDKRVIDDPLLLDRLMQLQGHMLAQRCHSLRMVTVSERKEDPGLAGLIGKLEACEVRHGMSELALDSLGEIGMVLADSPHTREEGIWWEHLGFDLGLIIGGGTAQIQKNIISERGLGMPREPKLAA